MYRQPSSALSLGVSCGGSTPLTPSNILNALADFTDLVTLHLIQWWGISALIRFRGCFRYTSDYLLFVCLSSLIAITNHNATHLTVMDIIFNLVGIAAHNTVINFIIMTIEQIAYYQINLKGFKAEVARDWLVNLAQNKIQFDDFRHVMRDTLIYLIPAWADHHLRLHPPW